MHVSPHDEPLSLGVAELKEFVSDGLHVAEATDRRFSDNIILVSERGHDPVPCIELAGSNNVPRSRLSPVGRPSIGRGGAHKAAFARGSPRPRAVSTRRRQNSGPPCDFSQSFCAGLATTSPSPSTEYTCRRCYSRDSYDTHRYYYNNI